MKGRSIGKWIGLTPVMLGKIVSSNVETYLTNIFQRKAMNCLAVKREIVAHLP